MSWGTFFTPQEDNIVRSLWAKKKSQRVIASLLGKTVNQVAGRISRLGLRDQSKPRPKRAGSPPRVWTKGDRWTLAAKYKKGLSYTQIGLELIPIASERTVRTEVKRLGLPRRPVVRLKKSTKVAKAQAKRSGKRTKPKQCDLPPEPIPSHGMFFLPRNRCQWIANKYVPDSGDLQKCGEQVVAGRPYCPGHEARVWRPREEREAA
jgi:hypothetical protein